MVSWLRNAVLLAAALAAAPLRAQNRPTADRSDPALIRQELDRDQREPQPQRRDVEVRGPAVEGSAARVEIVAGAIRIAGATRVSQAAFAPAIQPYLGRVLSQEDLVRLATDVAGVMRRQGYGLATAWIPAQDVVGGILTVQVDEGHIAEVRATGPAARLVENQLRAAVGDRPVLTRELERQLLIVGDLAGLWVGDARLIRERGRNVLTVATRYDHVHAVVTIDNWGSSAVGPVRAWTEVSFAGLARAGDELTLGAAVTPLQPREFQFVEARYQIPVGTGGTLIGIGGYYGHSRTNGTATSDPVEGDSAAVNLSVVQPIVRSRRASLWFNGQVELRDSKLDSAGAPFRDDRVVAASLSLFGTGRFAGGRLRGRIGLVQGLDILGATESGDPLASRLDADSVFTKLESWAEFVRPLGGNFSVALATRSQISDGPLLASEEMGLGGPQFLRAFDYREASRDEGIAGSAELRFDLKRFSPAVERLQLYLYVDGGHVRDHGGGSDDLSSAGFGARLRLRSGWEAEAGLGVPLTDGTRDPDPQPRFSFSITARF